MINWPVIIKYLGDNELSYVANQSVWIEKYLVGINHFQVGDQLIDSKGAVYQLGEGVNLEEALPEVMITLDELTKVVRLHASELGQCCIQKMVFSSVSLAIGSVAVMTDDESGV